MRKRKPLTDREGEVRELTSEDFKHFRPVGEVLPPASLKRLGLSPQTKKKVTLQLSEDVLQRFRSSGTDWQARLDEALREWLETHSP